MRLDERSLPLAVRALCAADSDLGSVVDRWGSPPLWAREPGFPTLVRIVLEQQVSLASADAAFRRLHAALSRLTPHAFLTLSDRRLKEIGFSRQKASYCRGIAEEIDGGSLRLSHLARMGDESARRRLLRIRGVGPWTADIYMLMALGRPDVWPTGDLALLTAAREVFGHRRARNQEALATMAGTWKPWRSVAARILWHHYLSR